MKNIFVGLIVVVLMAAAGYGGYYYRQAEVNKLNQEKAELSNKLQAANDDLSKQPIYTYKSAAGVDVTIFSPTAESKVSFPLAVMGMAPGNWSFEAQFTLELKDADGKRIAQTAAKIIGDWMTTDSRSFTATLNPEVKPSGKGSIVLHKANPSGLPANDDSLTLPVNF